MDSQLSPLEIARSRLSQCKKDENESERSLVYFKQHRDNSERQLSSARFNNASVADVEYLRRKIDKHEEHIALGKRLNRAYVSLNEHLQTEIYHREHDNHDFLPNVEMQQVTETIAETEEIKQLLSSWITQYREFREAYPGDQSTNEYSLRCHCGHLPGYHP